MNLLLRLLNPQCGSELCNQHPKGSPSTEGPIEQPFGVNSKVSMLFMAIDKW